MSFLNNLEWRFATKDFSSDKKISEKDLNKILKAIRLAPTSFGLQPFHVFVVTNKSLKTKLKVVSFSQPQVTEANHLLVFCARIDVKERINQYIKLMKANGEKDENRLKSRQDIMEDSMAKKSDGQILEWAKQQVYIALGFALAACAELKIDSCPMAGFQPEQVDEILELPKNLKSVVYLALGFRAEPPKRPKIRFSNDDLFTFK